MYVYMVFFFSQSIHWFVARSVGQLVSTSPNERNRLRAFWMRGPWLCPRALKITPMDTILPELHALSRHPVSWKIICSRFGRDLPWHLVHGLAFGPTKRRQRTRSRRYFSEAVRQTVEHTFFYSLQIIIMAEQLLCLVFLTSIHKAGF